LIFAEKPVAALAYRMTQNVFNRFHIPIQDHCQGFINIYIVLLTLMPIAETG